MIVIDSEPKNEVYYSVIDLAFDICDEFILVVERSYPPSLNNNGKLILKKLRPFFIEKKKQSEWAGTTLAKGDTAFVYHYRTDPGAKEIIKEVSRSLYDWVHRDFPEDLSFYKNGKPWLVNVSHERISHFNTDDESDIRSIKSIERLDTHSFKKRIRNF